jgi:uncharacterized integral membrane protein
MTEPELPIPVEEAGAPRGGRGRQFLSVCAALAAVVYFVLLIVKNSRRVPVDYVFGTSHARLIWLIVVSGFLGWLVGLATSFVLRRRMRRER